MYYVGHIHACFPLQKWLGSWRTKSSIIYSRESNWIKDSLSTLRPPKLQTNTNRGNHLWIPSRFRSVVTCWWQYHCHRTGGTSEKEKILFLVSRRYCILGVLCGFGIRPWITGCMKPCSKIQKGLKKTIILVKYIQF